MVHASKLLGVITAADPGARDVPLEQLCQGLSLEELLQEAEALDAFRRECDNLYERVRALFFLYALYRFHIPPHLSGADAVAGVSFVAHSHLLGRRFEEAIERFLEDLATEGISDGLSSALAKAYHALGIQFLADQVRSSVRAVRGNQWLFRLGSVKDYPLRIRSELLDSGDGAFPVVHETTAVRMDLSHSAWSDIFFLGMDFPQGARVLNISIDLAVHGRDPVAKPPVEAFFRVIDEPVIRLSSVDLGVSSEVSDLAEIFDFARDYLGARASINFRNH